LHNDHDDSQEYIMVMMVKSMVIMMIMSMVINDDNDDGLPFKTSGPEGHSNNEQSGPRRPKAYTTFNER